MSLRLPESSLKQFLYHSAGLLENGEANHTVFPGARALPVYAPHCPVVHKMDGTATILKDTYLHILLSTFPQVNAPGHW